MLQIFEIGHIVIAMKRASRRNPAPRADVKVLRREQLIDATMRTIAKRGYARTTMAHVAKAAGLSQGIVNFYFKSKEALLYETLVQLAEEYAALSQQAIERAGPDPVAALDAMIETDLGPVACSEKKVAVWVAFWAESRGRPKYRRLCANLSACYFDQVRELCESLARRGGYADLDVDAIARGLNSMIDGLWVDLVIDPGSFDREQAKRACRAYLAGNFPVEFGPLARGGRQAARQIG
jgi:TetR/AcrR family transcriptional repressor of bet genes